MSSTTPAVPFVAVLGPTAAGKSALGLELAQRLDGEIVSCDSLQVYLGMDIGTGKPTREERRLRPHHLLDLVRDTTSVVLGRQGGPPIDPGQPFKELGLDSLTAVELRNRIGTATA